MARPSSPERERHEDGHRNRVLNNTNQAIAHERRGETMYYYNAAQAATADYIPIAAQTG
jgi:hypothetical protein